MLATLSSLKLDQTRECLGISPTLTKYNIMMPGRFEFDQTHKEGDFLAVTTVRLDVQNVLRNCITKGYDGRG